MTAQLAIIKDRHHLCAAFRSHNHDEWAIYDFGSAGSNQAKTSLKESFKFFASSMVLLTPMLASVSINANASPQVIAAGIVYYAAANITLGETAVTKSAKLKGDNIKIYNLTAEQVEKTSKALEDIKGAKVYSLGFVNCITKTAKIARAAGLTKKRGILRGFNNILNSLPKADISARSAEELEMSPAYA